MDASSKFMDGCTGDATVQHLDGIFYSSLKMLAGASTARCSRACTCTGEKMLFRMIIGNILSLGIEFRKIKFRLGIKQNMSCFTAFSE